jgi:hypothetical protein
MGNAARILSFATFSSVLEPSVAVKFLRTLFQRCSDGFIEIRQVGNDQTVKREWMPINNIVNPMVAINMNGYFGVATRVYGRGSKKDIIKIPAVWGDIDFLWW